MEIRLYPDQSFPGTRLFRSQDLGIFRVTKSEIPKSKTQDASFSIFCANKDISFKKQSERYERQSEINNKNKKIRIEMTSDSAILYPSRGGWGRAGPNCPPDANKTPHCLCISTKVSAKAVFIQNIFYYVGEIKNKLYLEHIRTQELPISK